MDKSFEKRPRNRLNIDDSETEVLGVEEPADKRSPSAGWIESLLNPRSDHRLESRRDNCCGNRYHVRNNRYINRSDKQMHESEISVHSGSTGMQIEHSRTT
ncbi:MAG: hypothetical protein LC637_08410 [Xanthomonadaceae bacterium]|nr:hypothetical protein [Xanthomonadaceae bacterium]